MSRVEKTIIERYFSRGHRAADVSLGIGDDAALSRVDNGMELVTTIDTLVEGVHFPATLAPADIGYRALAVNLSDLAAMGARAHWALLSIACPSNVPEWFDGFAQGFFELAERHEVALIGGDLVRAPLSITVTALGQVPTGKALRRSGARPGDRLCVTGTPGAAAHGLAVLLGTQSHDAASELCFRRPIPRLTQGLGLRDLASAAIDLSDGLVADALNLATASDVAIEIDARAVAALSDHYPVETALHGGDDYELCFTIAPDRLAAVHELARHWDCPVTPIGIVGRGTGLSVPGYDVDALAGYDHFAKVTA